MWVPTELGMPRPTLCTQPSDLGYGAYADAFEPIPDSDGGSYEGEVTQVLFPT